jgi:hypothetical protein
LAVPVAATSPEEAVAKTWKRRVVVATPLVAAGAKTQGERSVFRNAASSGRREDEKRRRGVDKPRTG